RLNPPSLSIDCSTGCGSCTSCHATVLVHPIASAIASSQGNPYGQHSAHSGFGDKASAEQLHPSSVRPYLLGRERSRTPLPHWQQEEVAALMGVTPMMCEALASLRRAQLYLTERALSLALALASGIGYLSSASWEQAPVS